MRDYADILQADPFVTLNGNAVNVCHPTYGPSLDPNLTETVSATPLTPPLVAALHNAGLNGVAGPRINYADPYDPNFASTATAPLTAVRTGYLPTSCLSMNTANLTSGTITTATMNRFSPYGTVEYPVPGPNGLPSTYSGKLEASTTNTYSSVSTDTHTVSNSVSVSVSGTYPLPYGFSVSGGASAGTSNASTWQLQSSVTGTINKTAEAYYSITGPQLSDNYIGPATYNVYFDDVYGTYAFYSDLEPPVTPTELGNIGINIAGTNCSDVSANPCLSVIGPGPNSSVAYGSSTGLYPVTLTNNSQFPITMAGPAITFSDPGFLLDETDVTDLCSNKVVQPGGNCTANIIFTPVVADQPNTSNGVPASTNVLTYNGGATQYVNGVLTQVINADIIAAGTVNISSTNAVAAEQNILETNYAVVSAYVTNGSLGATLTPTGSVVSPSNPPPVFYNFGPWNGVGTPPTQQFTFTNNYTAPVEINQITYSDNTDFTTLSGTDECSGKTIQPSSQCTFTVQFSTRSASVYTSISVTGNIPPYEGMPAWNYGETFLLATAGAEGQMTSSLQATGFTLNFICGQNSIDPCKCTGNTSGAGTVTITNESTNLPVTIGNNVTLVQPYPSVDGQPIGTLTLSADNCESQLSNGSSCTLDITFSSTTSALCSAEPNMQYEGYVEVGSNTILGASAGVSIIVTPPLVNDSIKVSGTEQSNQVTTTAAPATGTITLKALTVQPSSRTASAEAARRDSTGAPTSRTPVRLLPVNPAFTQSTISAGVGGFTKAVNVPLGTDINDAAALLATQLNAAGSPVSAVANGPVISLTSLATGSGANLPLSAFVIGNYQVTPSGSTLTGGTTGGTTTNYDSGTVQVTTNGITASAPWGSASTPQSIATALAAAINQLAGAYWSATANGAVVNLTSVSNTSSNASPASNSAIPTARRARTTARGVSSAARIAPEAIQAEATTTTPANQITVTVTDSAGFASPSFTATTN